MWYTEPVGKGRRLGWLLRVNRLYTTQSRYNRLRNFAAEFSRDGSGAPAVGTFSRWETGASTAPYRAVRRYERVLNQPGFRFRDPMLPRLIDELLCDPVFDVRLYAAFLLYATPYRQPLGRALGQELVAARHSGNTQLVVTLLEALRILGGPEERRHVERLLLAPSTPSGIRDTAASALGHIGGASREDYWTLALRTARQRWRQTPTGAEASVLDRLVYALGMADRRALLRAVTADSTLPDRVRSAARWWITLPSHIRHSARM